MQPDFVLSRLKLKKFGTLLALFEANWGGGAGIDMVM